jgi:hypothetical protein
VRPDIFGARRDRALVLFDSMPASGDMMAQGDGKEDAMGSKMTLAAVAGAVLLAGTVMLATTANALRMHDDIYYYGSVTPRYGYTPRHPFGAYWLYARPHCARYQQFLPMTGGIVYHGLRCR